MELSDLKGVGEVRLQSLTRAGIVSIKDLLGIMPVSYMDTTSPVRVKDLAEGHEACVEGCLQGAPRLRYLKGLSIVQVQFTDGEAPLRLTWFNQPWMARQFHKDEAVVFYGRVQNYGGSLCMLNPQRVTFKALTPKYAAIENVPGKVLAGFIAQAIDHIDGYFPETLPQRILDDYGLSSRNEAVIQAHRPTDCTTLAAAQRRIGFENLLFYQLAVRLTHKREEAGHRLNVTSKDLSAFRAALPFELTSAQSKTLEEIFCDLTCGRSMNRLLQGDVGSGKTAVAFGAVYLAFRSGLQSAMMAPTEILARQHVATAEKLLAPMGIRCGLLLGGMRAKERREALANVESGEWQLVIGTHALISGSVKYRNLGLVITDEQHRFGVRQRKILGDKAAGDIRPHVLVMSATPIPRTLALILYGDLDVSTIDSMPPGRTPVQTRIVPDNKRGQLYGYIREAAARGEQAFLVCPLVEESLMSEGKNATDMYEDLRTGALKDLRLGLTYGSQPSAEKEETIARFSRGEMDVLVSTTVIEVGVDVPGATIMVIEDANRFGLSQLHQLRGRVGRGKKPSWCFLLGEPNERLTALCATNDGFVIAQKDLDLRGPGEFLGTRQHGRIMPEAYGVTDLKLIEETRSCVEGIVALPQEDLERIQLEQTAVNKYRTALENAAMN